MSKICERTLPHAEAAKFSSMDRYRGLATTQRGLAAAASLPLVRAQFLKSAERFEFLASGLDDLRQADALEGWLGVAKMDAAPLSRLARQ